MPVTFAINPVLDLLRGQVTATLTEAGEAPGYLESAETAEQVAFLASGLPATVLEIKTCKSSYDDCPANSVRLCQTVLVHHARRLEAGGSASDTATDRLAALARDLHADYRLEGVASEDSPCVERVRILGLVRGEDNPVQMILDQNDQNASVAAAALHLEIDWVEDEDLFVRIKIIADEDNAAVKDVPKKTPCPLRPGVYACPVT